MKMIADQVVSLVSRLAAPRGPNAVCEPWPPKAPARSALLPCCRRITAIRKRQTMTWMMVRRMIIAGLFLFEADADRRTLLSKYSTNLSKLFGAEEGT